MNERTSSSLRRWIVRAIIALGVLAALIGLSAVAFHLYQRHRVERALAAIRARGEPVMPDEIAFEPRKSPSNFQDNAARCESVLESGVDGEEEFDSTNPGPLLDGARGPGLPSSVRSALEELRSCLDAARGDGENVERYDWMELDSAPDIESSRCFAVAHRARRIVLEPSIAAIQELCRGDPLDAKASLDTWASADAPESPYPTDDGLPLARGAHNLLSTAIDASIEARSEEALSHVRTIFEGSTKIEDVPWLSGYQTWLSVHMNALTGLERVLRRSPHGLQLSGLDRYLDPELPRRKLNRALLGERAVVSRTFENFKGIWNEALREDPRNWSAVFLLTYSIRDYAEYLERMARAIEAARDPYWEAVRAGRTNFDMEEWEIKWEIVTAILLPRVEDIFRWCARDQAGILLARCALVTCREGVEAGQREAGRSIDPFSGEPLHARIDPTGTLVIWSVGTNLVDDNATADDPYDWKTNLPLDIVWRIPVR